MAFMDEHGLDRLTLRSLGASVHMHHTAIYRYFATKDDLLAAIFTAYAGDLLEKSARDPRPAGDRLRALCLGLRQTFREHSQLVPAVVMAGGSLPHANEFQGQVLAMLREMGVPEERLARTYQALETHVIGSSYYDFAASPHHLDQRRVRYRATTDAALDLHCRRTEDIDAMNEDAFSWVLDRMLDAAGRG